MSEKEFSKNKKKRLEILSFSILPKHFEKSIEPSLRNSADKNGQRKKEKTKERTNFFNVFRFKRKILIINNKISIKSSV